MQQIEENSPANFKAQKDVRTYEAFMGFSTTRLTRCNQQFVGMNSQAEK